MTRPRGTVTFLVAEAAGGENGLADAVAAAGGAVLGREPLRAVFGSAGSAVAALAAEPAPAGLRAALHTGEAPAGEPDYDGPAQELASRLAAEARPRQVLLSATTARLVESELPAPARLLDLGPRPLLGLVRPVHVFQLVLPGLDAASSQTVPPRRPGPPLLERDAELAEIGAVVDALEGGAGRVVAIEGRAGMGKTRLLAEARAGAAERGLGVLFARGAEIEHGFAFGIVRQLFEPMLATAPPGERDELLSGAAALAGPLFTGAAALDQPEAADASFSILHGLYWLAANTALRRPTVLAIDDLHWADAPSLRWLGYLARRLEGLPLLVLAGTRPPEQATEPELLTELLADAGTSLVRPGALGTASVAHMVEQTLGAAPEPAFAEACLTATGGNPLFLDSLLATLAAQGVRPVAAEAARVEEVGPEPVARVVALRLSRLPAEAHDLARAVAVLGGDARVADAAALAGLDRDVAAHAAVALGRADVLRLEPPLDFVHPVVRAAVYEQVPPPARAEQHRRAAGVLAAGGAQPEQVAAHLLLSTPAADPAVVATLRAAARRALARGAPDAAARYLRRALDEQPTGPERVDLLVELGYAHRRLDLAATVRYLSEAIEHLDDRVRRGEVALELGRNLRWTERGEEAVRVFEEAIEQLGDAAPELRQTIESELFSSAGLNPAFNEVAQERMATVDEGALVGFGRAAMVATLRYFDARRGEGRDRFGSLADPELQRTLVHGEPSTALASGIVALVMAELDNDADCFLALAVDDALRRGEAVMLSSTLIYRGQLALRRGDLAEAEDDLRRSRELTPYDDTHRGPAYWYAFLAEALLERGDVDGAAAVLAELDSAHPPPATHFVYFLHARARVARARNEHDRAREDLEEVGRIAETYGLLNPEFVPWRSELAQVLGDRDEAVRLADEEVARARAWGAPRALGIALRARGLVAGDLESLREAVTVLEDSRARLELARALVDLGAALRRGNRRSESRDVLRRGLELAHRLGAAPLEATAQAELQATGARPRRLVLSGVDSLTPSERRVAELAAGGMTNRDVAQSLFVTPKTVEVHLSSVYRKLGIASRAQLEPALATAPA